MAKAIRHDVMVEVGLVKEEGEEKIEEKAPPKPAAKKKPPRGHK